MTFARPTAALAALFLTVAGVATVSAAPPAVVAEPWVRATVPQQTSSAFYARITSSAGGRLVGVSSPVAGVVELHTMVMDGDVMRMRALPALDLPAGQVVELKPGGYHVMLMALSRQLVAGESVPVTLTIEDDGKQRRTIEVRASVRPLGAAAARH